VLGIPYTEELALQSSVTPGHAAQQLPPSNKRQKLSQHDAIQNALAPSNTAEQQLSGDGQQQSGDGQHHSGDGQHHSDDGQQQSGDGQHQLGDGQHHSGDGQHQSGEGQHQLGDGQYQSGDGQHQSGDGQHQSGNGQHQSGDGQHQSGDGQHQSDAAQRPRVVKVIRLQGINALCALDRKGEDSYEPGQWHTETPPFAGGTTLDLRAPSSS